jgi:pimeloyl-CoA synthetase
MIQSLPPYYLTNEFAVQDTETQPLIVSETVEEAWAIQSKVHDHQALYEEVCYSAASLPFRFMSPLT